MLVDNKLYIGNSNGEKAYIYLNKANRHGIIAGSPRHHRRCHRYR